jgi:hypothetical protein
VAHAHSHDSESPNGRRAFLGKLAATAAAGAAGISLTSALDAELLAATPSAIPDAEHWLDPLKGKHKQLVDAYAPNEGFPLAFAFTFMAAQSPADTPVGSVIVLRHFAMPFALNSSLWEKYKIGEGIKLMDPQTKQPATRNMFYKAPAGSLPLEDMAVDKLMAKGVIIGACNMALQFLSSEFAGNAGVSKEVAAKEWSDGIIPGITLLPSGTWGVNRAQEKGCTYCTGGG